MEAAYRQREEEGAVDSHYRQEVVEAVEFHLQVEEEQLFRLHL